MMGFVGSGDMLRGGFRVQKKALVGRRWGGLTMSASAAPVVLCPGQGAQAVGMGAAWKERSPAAGKIFQRADRVLGDRLGMPLSEIIFAGPKDRLDRTDVAQPAIFVTSIASWEGMKELELVPPGAPAATAGLSLGEYSALVVAGAIEFEKALELVALRGLAMQEASEAVLSTMCALIGADDEKVQLCIDYGLRKHPNQVLVAANYNAPGQVVLSGSMNACKSAAEYATEELKIRAVVLDVAGAFHSPIMAPAAERLGEALAKTDILVPECPVLANVTALPHENDPESIRRRLVEQLTNPTRWADCMEYCKTHPDLIGDGPWVELAPGKTLTGIMRKCDRRRKITSYDSPPELLTL